MAAFVAHFVIDLVEWLVCSGRHQDIAMLREESGDMPLYGIFIFLYFDRRLEAYLSIVVFILAGARTGCGIVDTVVFDYFWGSLWMMATLGAWYEFLRLLLELFEED
jgi:hypothetical protein